MQPRGFKTSLLITAFFVACTAPVYAQTATEAAEPAAPAAAQTEPGLGSITGTVSKVTPSGFMLTHDRGDTPVIVDQQTERGEIGALKDGDRVTIIGKVNQEAKAIEARSITRVQSNASASAAGTTANAAPAAGAMESKAEPSAQAAASAVAKPSEGEMSSQAAAAPANDSAAPTASDVGPSSLASAQPSAADAEIAARLKLSADADLPPQVMAEVSDGEYTTADLNRAALLAMNATPMPAMRAQPAAMSGAAPSAGAFAPADASAPPEEDMAMPADRGAPPPVAPEEATPADDEADQQPDDM